MAAFHRHKIAQTKVSRGPIRLTKTLFCIYLIALYWILILKLGVRFSYMGERRANLIPFKYTTLLAGANILNVAIFIPLGIYASILFKKWHFSLKLLFIFLSSLTVEAVQYILRIGAFDITDIITNTTGGIIGLIIAAVLAKSFGSSDRAQRFINTIAALGTVLMILLLVLLKMNMLPVRYQ